MWLWSALMLMWVSRWGVRSAAEVHGGLITELNSIGLCNRLQQQLEHYHLLTSSISGKTRVTQDRYANESKDLVHTILNSKSFFMILKALSKNNTTLLPPHVIHIQRILALARCKLCRTLHVKCKCKLYK